MKNKLTYDRPDIDSLFSLAIKASSFESVTVLLNNEDYAPGRGHLLNSIGHLDNDAIAASGILVRDCTDIVRSIAHAIATRWEPEAAAHNLDRALKITYGMLSDYPEQIDSNSVWGKRKQNLSKVTEIIESALQQMPKASRPLSVPEEVQQARLPAP